MTTYYVGSGGSNANNGTSWATRKLTLNGAEDVPVVAGDTVYVGPGTYRELLTVDVSGSSGSPITYIGDYTGANTDGVGGVVRVTGSDDDQSATRTNCISITTKVYRTFQGFLFDTNSNVSVNLSTSCTNIIIDKCLFAHPSGNPNISITGATQAAITIQNCYFLGHPNSNAAVSITHTTTADNVGHTIQNCVFIGSASGIRSDRVGGFTVKNCLFLGRFQGIQVGVALSAGQTITVNNSLFQGNSTAVIATATGEITEDYNSFFSCTTNRSNTNTGANSKTYPALFDPRWFFQLTTAGAGPNSSTQLVTPFDLASFSQLVNLAGTSPTTTDMRGTAAISSVREWGVLEYDSTLKKAGGGGAVSILPRTGF